MCLHTKFLAYCEGKMLERHKGAVLGMGLSNETIVPLQTKQPRSTWIRYKLGNTIH